MNPRPLTTMGLDWFLSSVALASTPGNGTFHRTLASSLPPQVRGRSFSSETPWPVGPRHDGQSAPSTAVAVRRSATPASGKTGRMVGSSRLQLRLALVQDRLGRRGAHAGD